MNDIEKRARELLSDELEKISFWSMAAEVRDVDGENTIGQVMVRVVVAALTAQWQPIESAPRDGTHFLALTGSKRQRVDYKHQEVPASLFWQERPLDRYTHWMPLPAAPEAP